MINTVKILGCKFFLREHYIKSSLTLIKIQLPNKPGKKIIRLFTRTNLNQHILCFQKSLYQNVKNSSTNRSLSHSFPILVKLNRHALKNQTILQNINQSINLKFNEQGQIWFILEQYWIIKSRKGRNAFLTICFNDTFKVKTIKYIYHFLYQLKVQKS